MGREIVMFSSDLERRLVTLEARQYADSDAFEERLRRLETHLPTQRRIEISQSLETDKPVADENAIGERIEKLEDALKLELADHLGNITSKFDALVEKLAESKVVYQKIGEKYYYIHNCVERSWTDAQLFCDQKNGHLATLQNEEEWEALAEHLKSDKNYWVDINDRDDEEFISDFTQKKPKFLKWSDDEPNNGGEYEFIEDCVELQGNNNFYMNDAQCSNHNLFICEFEPQCIS
ncbi:C-type lectin 37Db-like [Drosophila subpulchrella]|uniref:C-type lectin 37Db-like n=1 Tax=Drosophila subpulchrella TaxID=1486046 RepID=UPI0018A16ECA|nr:C-type lectin 37Db-like [Drosophila subpulchrella]